MRGGSQADALVGGVRSAWRLGGRTAPGPAEGICSSPAAPPGWPRPGVGAAWAADTSLPSVRRAHAGLPAGPLTGALRPADRRRPFPGPCTSAAARGAFACLLRGGRRMSSAGFAAPRSPRGCGRRRAARTCAGRPVAEARLSRSGRGAVPYTVTGAARCGFGRRCRPDHGAAGRLAGHGACFGRARTVAAGPAAPIRCLRRAKTRRRRKRSAAAARVLVSSTLHRDGHFGPVSLVDGEVGKRPGDLGAFAGQDGPAFAGVEDGEIGEAGQVR